MKLRVLPLAGALWGLCIALFALSGGQATAGDIFAASNIPVDVTAKNAELARQQAIAEGRGIALRHVLERLTLAVDHDRLPAPAPEMLEEMEREFGVISEKASSVRYIAALRFAFEPDAVRSLLREAGIGVAETVSKRLVVVPVLDTGQSPRLWEEDNPWRAAWNAEDPEDGLIPLVQPLGDLADISGAPVAQVLAGDGATLLTLARRYNAGGALVMQAQPQADQLHITVQWLTDDARRNPVRLSVALPAGDLTAEALRPAVLETRAALEESWKQATLIRYEVRSSLAARVPVETLGEWVSIRDGLATLPVIQETEVVSLSPGEARIMVHYLGEIDQLVLALAQRNLILEETLGDWVLRRSLPQN
ncbi:MAG: DUF2066 domain-containing protein [Magnetospiraceae bacterium]